MPEPVTPTREAVKVARELERAQLRLRKARAVVLDREEAVRKLKRELRMLIDAAELPMDGEPRGIEP